MQLRVMTTKLLIFMLLEKAIQDGFFKRTLKAEEEIFLILDGWDKNRPHTVDFACEHVGKNLVAHKSRLLFF